MLKTDIEIQNPSQTLKMLLDKTVTVHAETGRVSLVVGQFYTYENDPAIYAEPFYVPYPFCLPFYWYAKLCKRILK